MWYHFFVFFIPCHFGSQLLFKFRQQNINWVWRKMIYTKCIVSKLLKCSYTAVVIHQKPSYSLAAFLFNKTVSITDTLYCQPFSPVAPTWVLIKMKCFLHKAGCNLWNFWSAHFLFHVPFSSHTAQCFDSQLHWVCEGGGPVWLLPESRMETRRLHSSCGSKSTLYHLVLLLQTF